MQLSMTIL